MSERAHDAPLPPRVALAVTHGRAGSSPAILGFVEQEIPGRRQAELMRLALREAEAAAGHEDVPIGAVLARGGEPLARAGNERELRGDPTAHAEVLAIREAARLVGGWRLAGCELYVTLEPCAMCAGAIVLARLDRVVYGADDPKAGAAGGVLDILGESRLNHRPAVARGLLADESAALLRSFFAARRPPQTRDAAASSADSSTG
jgi:tRNA(adenine34) deaminase